MYMKMLIRQIFNMLTAEGEGKYEKISKESGDINITDAM